MIVSKIKKIGFYSSFFFIINHYIYCQKNNITFKLDDTDWLYKCLHGWEDYFINIHKKRNDLSNIQYVTHGHQFQKYPLYEYKNVISEIYIYNEYIKMHIDSTINFLELNNKKYDSIYIRRGDKLVNESVFIPTYKYIELLLQKNPLCTDLFVQTDDYNSVIDIQNYIDEKELIITLYTICKPETKGFFCERYNIENIKNDLIISKNKEYVSKIKKDVINSIALSEMTPTEINEHTTNLLIGVDILLHSNICVCDYQSNVSRFIKLAHQNFDNVFNVLNPNQNIDLNVYCSCPAWPTEPFC
jgi:hypothetical protein